MIDNRVSVQETQLRSNLRKSNLRSSKTVSTTVIGTPVILNNGIIGSRGSRIITVDQIPPGAEIIRVEKPAEYVYHNTPLPPTTYELTDRVKTRGRSWWVRLIIGLLVLLLLTGSLFGIYFAINKNRGQKLKNNQNSLHRQQKIQQKNQNISHYSEQLKTSHITVQESLAKTCKQGQFSLNDKCLKCPSGLFWNGFNCGTKQTPRKHYHLQQDKNQLNDNNSNKNQLQNRNQQDNLNSQNQTSQNQNQSEEVPNQNQNNENSSLTLQAKQLNISINNPENNISNQQLSANSANITLNQQNSNITQDNKQNHQHLPNSHYGLISLTRQAGRGIYSGAASVGRGTRRVGSKVLGGVQRVGQSIFS